MKVSIIVPVYNAEKYLEKCLDSLVNQSLDDYEIILINDGSNDGSQKIIDRYREQYPEKIVSRTVDNGGQGRARNIGMDMARGDFLGFADSDDWASPDMYRLLYKAAVEVNADLAVCDAVKYYEDGRMEYFPISRYEKLIKIDTAVWNKLVRKDLAEGIRFPEGRLWYEDLCFVVRLIMKSQAQARVTDALYYYRVGQTSTMNNDNSAKNLDVISIMELLKDDMLRKGRKEDFESLVLNHVLLDSMNRVNFQNSPDRKKVMEKLRKYVKENIPVLSECTAFRQESLNRRIIMTLYYNGHPDEAAFILKARRRVK